LQRFSLAATRFEVSGLWGYLAVLGPRRMQYARTIALIRAIAQYLERMG
jgi:transcriptional regulator of heat shock response